MIGVAMTLVVNTLLPSVQAGKGAVLGMLTNLNAELVAIVLGFAISARYWVFQQQRLAMTTVVTPLETFLHLTFLFLVVLIPISTSLNGLTGSGARLASVMIFGSHLCLLALVNLLLWIEVHRNVPSANRAVLRSGHLAFRSLGRGRNSAQSRPICLVCCTGRTASGRHLTRYIYAV
jgi:uncharacterized membrane protein